MSMIKRENTEARIINSRGENLLIDSNVGEIYGVETKRVNEAVKNNLDRFPDDYLIELTQAEKQELVENFDRIERLKHSTTMPKAFAEKSLYILATVSEGGC